MLVVAALIVRRQAGNDEDVHAKAIGQDKNDNEEEV